MVEQETVNLKVIGSIPILSERLFFGSSFFHFKKVKWRGFHSLIGRAIDCDSEGAGSSPAENPSSNVI